MKHHLWLLVVISILALPAVAESLKRQAQADSPCSVIDQALNNYQQIKAGVHRKDVERYFDREGGMQFPSATRYVYAKCRYLHVDVEFEAHGKSDSPLSPDDVVIKFSKLYVDYSAKD
jgi:hypothetical protein